MTKEAETKTKAPSDDLPVGAVSRSRRKDAKPAAEAVSAPEWVMPDAEVGDVVLWGPDQGGPLESMAVITRVYDRGVNLAVLEPGFINVNPFEGVRHNDDPERHAVRSTAVGVWKHTPQRDRLDELMVRFGTVVSVVQLLVSRVEELESQLGVGQTPAPPATAP